MYAVWCFWIYCNSLAKSVNGSKILGIVIVYCLIKSNYCHTSAQSGDSFVEKSALHFKAEYLKSFNGVAVVVLFFKYMYVLVWQNLENNWRTGHHTLQRIVCRSETSKGVYCLQYDDKKIISGLRDNTIKVGVIMLWVYR